MFRFISMLCVIFLLGYAIIGEQFMQDLGRVTGEFMEFVANDEIIQELGYEVRNIVDNFQRGYEKTNE